MRIIVTAGPTAEDVDDVRYISNRSSGRLGYAIAERFALLGHETTLVSGPVCLEPPGGVERVSIRSAQEMADALASRFPSADVLVMAAAVADYRPSQRIAGKIKKDADELMLTLVKTVDVLETISRMRTERQTVIGFALEADGPSAPGARGAALEKAARKNLDAIVLNGPENIGGRSGEIAVFDRSGREIARKRGLKDELAKVIVDVALTLHAEKAG